MLSNTTIPAEIQAQLNSEQPDFAIKAGRYEFLSVSITKIVFASVFLLMIVGAALIIYYSASSGDSYNVTINGEAVDVTSSNYSLFIEPAVVLIFLLLSIGYTIITGIKNLKKEGGYFVGTSTRIITFADDKINEFNWNQISDVKLFGADNELATVVLKLKPGVVKKTSRKSSRKNHNAIVMIEIPEAKEIEQVCKKRIGI